MAGPEPVRVLYTGRLLNGVSKNALTAGRYSLVPAMRGGREQVEERGHFRRELVSAVVGGEKRERGGGFNFMRHVVDV